MGVSVAGSKEAVGTISSVAGEGAEGTEEEQAVSANAMMRKKVLLNFIAILVKRHLCHILG